MIPKALALTRPMTVAMWVTRRAGDRLENIP